jgi:hypothetical protein
MLLDVADLFKKNIIAAMMFGQLRFKYQYKNARTLSRGLDALS